MAERENKREEILEAAGDLFTQQGYAGTSTKQIADAVGCTKAALYYHFKDGKEELYHCVLETRGPDLTSALAECEKAESLKELILCVTSNMRKHSPHIMERLRWITTEFPNFSEAQRQILRDKKVMHLRGFSELISRFVDNREEAVSIAVMTMSAMIGYHQVFVQMGTEAELGTTLEEYMQFLAEIIAARY